MTDPDTPDRRLDLPPPWRDMPPALWRSAVGLVCFLLLYSLLLSLYFIAVSPLLAVLPAGRQAVTLMMLLSFATALLALEVVMRGLHGRGLATLFGMIPDALPLTLRQGARVLVYALPVVAILMALPLPEGMTPRRHLGTFAWISWLPLGLLAIAVQITAEEVLFRGYLQSRLRLRFAHPLLWLVLPAVLFGVLHYDAGSGDNALWFVASAVAFGLAAGDLTERSGTLGPALALHFLNNCIAILGTSFADELGGLALFHLPIRQDDPVLLSLIPMELASTFVLWLTARLALRR